MMIIAIFSYMVMLLFWLSTELLYKVLFGLLYMTAWLYFFFLFSAVHRELYCSKDLIRMVLSGYYWTFKVIWLLASSDAFLQVLIALLP